MSEVLLSREEHIALIERAFTKRWPNSRLYHKKQVYAGGSSVRFTYEDGPPMSVAEAFFKSMNTSDYDARSDYWGSRAIEVDGVRYRGGLSHVFVERTYSGDPISQRISELLCEYGLSNASDYLPSGRSVWNTAREQIAASDRSAIRAPKPPAPISFAQLKRSLHVGVQLRTEYLEADGSISRVVGPRAIINVQSNAITLEHTPGAGGTNGSWLYWDQGARGVAIDSPTSFTILDRQGTPRARYQIVEPVQHAEAA